MAQLLVVLLKMKTTLAPWIPPVVGLILMGAYSALNLVGEVFVHRLGCGCHRGFNTNSLTLLVGLAIGVTVFAGCLRSSTSVRPSLRSGYVASTVGASTMILFAFVFLNAWA